jgi:hypothetical protein
MDAGIGLLSSRSKTAEVFVTAREILRFKKVAAVIWRTGRGEFCPSTEGTVSDAEDPIQKLVTSFISGCSEDKKCSAALVKLQSAILVRPPALALLPVMISAKPVNGQPGMGQWVTIQYTFTYARKGRHSQDMEVRRASIHVGVLRCAGHEHDWMRGPADSQ